MFWETFSNLWHHAQKEDALKFDEEIDLSNLVTKHNDGPLSERLFEHSLCQNDNLSPNVDLGGIKEDIDFGVHVPAKLIPSAQVSASFHRLTEQMLCKSLEKEIQTPDNPDIEAGPAVRITKLHQMLEAQMRSLNELIQEKIICTIRILDYPIASKAVDKVFEQDPVGFTDALCFVISVATKIIAEDIQNKTLSLSQPDKNTLRKKFYRLTASIESMRKTRVKVFSQFNKQVIALLEAMVFNNEFEMDEEEKIFPIPLLPRNKSKYCSPLVSDDSSFESLFWGNYSQIVESLKDDVVWKDPKRLPHGEMELRWEAWNKDKITCRASADKLFYLRSLDIHTQLRILFGILDLAATNMENAELSLKKALSDFHLAKRILNEFSKNIRISNLQAIEIQEILKVIRISVATSVTFLKSIEKTTRMSRFCVSEGIQSLRGALGQTDKKSSEFSYKPNYLVLLLTIKCGPGISPILKEIEAIPGLPGLEIGPLASALTRKSSWKESSKFVKDNDLATKIKTISSVVTQEFVGNQIEEETSDRKKTEIPEELDTIIELPYSPSKSSEEHEFQLYFLKEVEKLEPLLKDHLHQAYSVLYLPNPTANVDDADMPLISALCVIILQAAVLIQPYKDVSPAVREALHESFTELSNSASFGNPSKKNLIRKLAVALRKGSDQIRKLAALLLVVPEYPTSIEASNELFPDGNFLAEQESKAQKRDLWQLRWTKATGLVMKNMRTNQVANYMNFGVKTKCEVLLDLVAFADFVLKVAEKNLHVVRDGSASVEESIKGMSKKLRKHFKQHTLALNDQMFFAKAIGRLKQSHKESVLLLAALSAGMTQVVGILTVLNSYLRVMSVFTHEKNLELMQQQNINSNHVLARKIEQVRRYTNDLVKCPLSVQVPIKIDAKHFFQI